MQVGFLHLSGFAPPTAQRGGWGLLQAPTDQPNPDVEVGLDALYSSRLSEL